MFSFRFVNSVYFDSIKRKLLNLSKNLNLSFKNIKKIIQIMISWFVCVQLKLQLILLFLGETTNDGAE